MEGAGCSSDSYQQTLKACDPCIVFAFAAVAMVVATEVAVVSAEVVLKAAVGCGGCHRWCWGWENGGCGCIKAVTVLCAFSAGLSLISIIKRPIDVQSFNGVRVYGRLENDSAIQIQLRNGSTTAKWLRAVLL